MKTVLPNGFGESEVPKHEDIEVRKPENRLASGRRLRSLAKSPTEWPEGGGSLPQDHSFEKAVSFKKAYGRFKLKRHGRGTLVTFAIDYTLRLGEEVTPEALRKVKMEAVRSLGCTGAPM